MLRLRLAAVVLIVSVSVKPVEAGFIAYDSDTTAPNQFFGNSLGLDFDVNHTIRVTRLGAYFGNDINNLTFQSQAGVTVGIYERNTMSLVGSSVIVSPANSVVVNGNAFVDLSTPLVLGPGLYSVVAFNSPNFNTHGAVNTTSTMNDGGGLITFVGSGRFGFTAGQFPTVVDGGPENRYNAGTFEFEAVPEPASLTLMGLGALSLLGRQVRRKLISRVDPGTAS